MDLNGYVCSLQGVSFRYSPRTPWVLRGIDLTVKRGTRVAVIGDNGTGKSTIGRLLLGCLKPDAGEVRVFGRRAGPALHYPQLGYVGDLSYFEGSGALPPDLPARLVIRGFEQLAFRRGRPRFASTLAERLGLDQPRFESPIGALSRGERQRVMLYLALAKLPALLIADEPTEGLDRASRREVLRLLEESVRETGTGVIWVTHRFDEIARLVDFVYELRDGKLTQVLKTGYRAYLSDGRTGTEYPNVPAEELVGLVADRLVSDPDRLEFMAVKHRTGGEA
jgi:ABC-type multidrug transport system ATPase subunit